MSAIKDLAKRLPLPLFVRLYNAYSLSVLTRQLEAKRRLLGLPLLSEYDLYQHKRSDTLFVLASGPSINQISPERWKAIAAHDTVAMNFWLFHPFIPTYYFMEAVSREAEPLVYDKLLELMERRARDYAGVPKIVMELQHEGTLSLAHAASQFRDTMYVSLNISTPARNDQEYVYGLHFLERRGWFRPERRFSRLYKYTASPTAMLAFAMKMGYRKVVLCGIDLRGREYFYHDEKLFPESANWEYIARAGIHPVWKDKHHSDTALEWRIPISRAVELMGQELLQPAGMELYVENRNSALFPAIPEAPESLFAPPSIAESAR